MIACECEVSSFAEALESSAYKDGELRACRALRGQIPLYIKGEFGASAIRDRLTRCSTVGEYEAILFEFEMQSRDRHAALA
jgi:hypothetical protein